MAAKFQIMYDITLYVDDPESWKYKKLDKALKDKNIPFFLVKGRQAKEVLKYSGYNEGPLLKLDKTILDYYSAKVWVDESEIQ